MTWYELSENVVILQTDVGNELAQGIQESGIQGITDVIPTEKEIAVEHSLRDIKLLIRALEGVTALSTGREAEIIELPVCFELGMDWDEYKEQTGKNQEEVIEEICSLELTVSYGFNPGFLYLSGLPSHLHCARKSVPRNRLPTGSVGIGGDKAGIYALESPGGWNILGRTGITLFDVEQSNPFCIPNGAKVKFAPITKAAFDA